jgi:hypothetical protein
MDSCACQEVSEDITLITLGAPPGYALEQVGTQSFGSPCQL